MMWHNGDTLPLYFGHKKLVFIWGYVRLFCVFLWAEHRDDNTIAETAIYSWFIFTEATLHDRRRVFVSFALVRQISSSILTSILAL